MVIVVMGVSGCGKSSVGVVLAERLGLPFFDADDFHPETNVSKMSRGEALNDADRAPWLALLAERIADWSSGGGAVLACSALRRSYREVLRGADAARVCFVLLDGSRDLIEARVNARAGHFMPAGLLDSQFATLERPDETTGDPAVVVGIDAPLSEVVDAIVAALPS